MSYRYSYQSSSLREVASWITTLDDAQLQHMQESRAGKDLLSAYERLRWQHRNAGGTHRPSKRQKNGESEASPPKLPEEVWKRIIPYLSASDLREKVAPMSKVFERWANSYAYKKTEFTREFFKELTPLEWLRAQEQLDHPIKEEDARKWNVTLPTRLPRPLVATGCGDSDFNGVYFCVGSTLEGYFFKKSLGDGQCCAISPSKTFPVSMYKMMDEYNLDCFAEEYYDSGPVFSFHRKDWMNKLYGLDKTDMPLPAYPEYSRKGHEDTSLCLELRDVIKHDALTRAEEEHFRQLEGETSDYYDDPYPFSGWDGPPSEDHSIDDVDAPCLSLLKKNRKKPMALRAGGAFPGRR